MFHIHLFFTCLPYCSSIPEEVMDFDSLELELQLIVSCHRGAQDGTQVLLYNSKCPYPLRYVFSTQSRHFCSLKMKTVSVSLDKHIDYCMNG